MFLRVGTHWGRHVLFPSWAEAFIRPPAVWHPAPTTVPCSRHAKLSLRSIRPNLPSSMRTLMESVSYHSLTLCAYHTLSLTTGNRPRIVYAKTPRGHRERGREARLRILAERPQRAGAGCVHAWQCGLSPNERCAQPHPRAPFRGRMCVSFSRCALQQDPQKLILTFQRLGLGQQRYELGSDVPYVVGAQTIEEQLKAFRRVRQRLSKVFRRSYRASHIVYVLATR